MPKNPSPELVELGTRALADALSDQHPGLTFVPTKDGTLPGAITADRKPSR